MSLYAQIILAMVLALGGVATGWKLGIDHTKANQADIDKAVQQTRDAAAEGAASVLSKLQPTQQTIIQRATHEIRTETKFADCKSGPGLLRSANAIAAGASAPDVPSELPRPDAP